MADRAFLDTNVLIYADEREGPKSAAARALIEAAFVAGAGVVSTQVLQEYFSVATKKRGMTPEFARRNVELYASLDVVTVDAPLVLAAIDLHRLHAISFWDALIVRAAAVAGCRRLLTEDLNAGQTIDGVRIENPFG